MIHWIYKYMSEDYPLHVHVVVMYIYNKQGHHEFHSNIFMVLHMCISQIQDFLNKYDLLSDYIAEVFLVTLVSISYLASLLCAFNFSSYNCCNFLSWLSLSVSPLLVKYLYPETPKCDTGIPIMRVKITGCFQLIRMSI